MIRKEELLEKYFTGALLENEVDEFNALLESDIEFKKEFDFQNDLKQVIKTKKRIELKELLNSYEDTVKEEVNRSKPYQGSWLKIAASFLILISAGAYFFNTNFVTSNEDLFNEFYETYPNTTYPIVRGGEAVNKTLDYKAYEAYERGDYTSAVQFFEKMVNDTNSKFYLGLSYLNEQKLVSAIPIFESIIAKNLKFKDEANWYLALAYVKQGKVDEAKEVLKDIISLQSFNYAKAKELLQEIE